jgi:hypothetical protein
MEYSSLTWIHSADYDSEEDVFARIYDSHKGNDHVYGRRRGARAEAPSAVGIDAVRATYTNIFHAIDIDLAFKAAEVRVVSPNWAFLRSTSNGSITILANGAQVPSSNQELFVLHKVRGSWKLVRYSFSSVLPSA